MNYISQVFTPTSLEHAKNICLTPDQSDPDKFINETNFFINFVKENYINSNSCVADFGCGMGRVSKQLIEQIGCDVVGFDISYPMLLTAKNYINNDKFDHIKYDKHLKTFNKKFDVVISILVLQHSEHPQEDLIFIKNILKPDGIFILVNEPKRFIPIDIENKQVVWYDDGIDIEKLTSDHFIPLSKNKYYNRKDNCLTIYKNKLQ